MVDHLCNLSYAGDIGRKIAVQADPCKKHETLSEK
jgi:hypothetical protein